MPTAKEAQDWLAHQLEEGTLAHHGVLGMHWGYRKNQIRATKRPKRILTTKEKADRRVKIATAVEAGIAITGTAGYFFLKNKAFLQTTLLHALLNARIRRGQKAAGSVLQAIGSKPITTMTQGADGIWRLAA